MVNAAGIAGIDSVGGRQMDEVKESVSKGLYAMQWLKAGERTEGRQGMKGIQGSPVI